MDSIRKCPDIPNQIDHIIIQLRGADLGREGEIDLLPLRNCFSKFPVSYETVNRNMKIIKIKSERCPKNVIFVHAQTFKSVLITGQNLRVKFGHNGCRAF